MKVEWVIVLLIVQGLKGLKIFGFFILVPSFSPQDLLPYMVSYSYISYFFVTIGTKRSKNYKSFESIKR